MSGQRIAVLGGGSAAEELARATEGKAEVTVFEPGLVGGECPFVACMPSKTMLHDSRSGVSWEDAVQRRRTVTEGLDDTGHAEELERLGVTLIRHRARVVDATTVEADGQRQTFDHVVLATGAETIVPELAGAAECDDRIWTSEDVYRSTELPQRVALIGAGVIGFEVADLYSGFGCSVTMVERGERAFESMPPDVGRVVADALGARGVDIRYGIEATGVVRASAGSVRLTLSDGSDVSADRVVVAVGRRPRTRDIGLESLGLDPTERLPVEPNGRVRCRGSVWAMGDVAGRGEYTHLANHHAGVVADHLVGTATRSYDEVVLGSCMFTAPPMIQVGPSWVDLRDDPDVVSVEQDLATFPRSMTDCLDPGYLWVAARRSTGCVVAASGAGPKFDELVHALVIAVDGHVPVDRLRLSMQPFPTIGEILGPIWNGLGDALHRPG